MDPTPKPNGKGPEVRIEQMDKDLKAFFEDQNKFIVFTVNAAEGRLAERIESAEGRVVTVEARLGKVEAKLGDLKTRLDKFEQTVKVGFRVLDGRIGYVTQRFDKLEKRMDRRFKSMNRRMSNGFAEINKKLDILMRSRPRLPKRR